jgi:hypothetical protein
MAPAGKVEPPFIRIRLKYTLPFIGGASQRYLIELGRAAAITVSSVNGCNWPLCSLQSAGLTGSFQV